MECRTKLRSQVTYASRFDLSLKGVAMTDQTFRQTSLPVRLLAALPPALLGWR